uniref:exonuclease 1 n=1 Tax=Myxine glutinosa TaxID=7769 RepID=UPI00358E7B30
MGIQGLLQFLKDATDQVSIKKYKGHTVAVDTYCWIHKGAFSCADILAKGKNTDQYVSYCMKYIEMMLSFEVKPILVFDGCTLPSKCEVEKSRRQNRQENLQRGKQLLREGKTSEARKYFNRCINVTPHMALQVMKAARARGVDCLVAPYEADAQLAYLNITGIAQAVITEDSDLLAFGCDRVIIKMDPVGNGLEISQQQLGRVKQLGGFTEEKFRHMCILAGCDYLPSIHGIGLGKASKLLQLSTNPDITKVIRKMGHYLKMNVTVPDEYLKGFQRAENTFRHQLVFDPLSLRLLPLHPYPEDIDPNQLHYAGPVISNKKAREIALGNIDINTMKTICDFTPGILQKTTPRKTGSWASNNTSKVAPHQLSIWDPNYKPQGKFGCGVKTPNPHDQRQSTRGKEKVIELPQLRTQVVNKRLREDESLMSDADLLSQYHVSAPKRMCQELCLTDKNDDFKGQKESKRKQQVISVQQSEYFPARSKRRLDDSTLGRISAILQKQQTQDTVVTLGTRSRFFSNSKPRECEERKELVAKEMTMSKLHCAQDADTEDSIHCNDTLINCSPSKPETKMSADSFQAEQSEESAVEIEHGTQRQRGSYGAFIWPNVKDDEENACKADSVVSMLSQFKMQPVHRKSMASRNPFAVVNHLSSNSVIKETESFDSGFSEESTSSSQKLFLLSGSPSSWDEGCSSQTETFNQNGNATLNSDCGDDGLETEYLPQKATIPPVHLKSPGLSRFKSMSTLRNQPANYMGKAKASGLRRKRYPNQTHLGEKRQEEKTQMTLTTLWQEYSFNKVVDKLPSARNFLPISPMEENSAQLLATEKNKSPQTWN